MDLNNGPNQNSSCASDFKIKHATLNVRGINNKDKRRRIFQWCKTHKLDIAFLQETYITEQKKNEVTKDWNGLSIHTLSNSSHSNGISILFRKTLNVEILDNHSSQDGRILLVNTKINNEYFSLVNVYAPCTNETAKKSFFNKCIKWVNDYAFDNNYLIVAGDFNCIDDPKDRYSQIVDLASNTFRKMKTSLSINDIWRQVNPTKIAYTYINPTDITKQSRIDYCFLSKVLSNLVKSCDIIPAPTPDHNALITSIEKLGRKRGNSIWKLNVEVLKEEDYRIGIEQLVDETLAEYNSSLLNRRKIWDLLKFRIRAFSIKYCSNRKRYNDWQYHELEKQLSEIEAKLALKNGPVNDLQSERAKLKLKLNTLNDQKAKGYYIRSRAKWLEEGERSTRYFLKLERKRQTYNRIDTLRNGNGEQIYDDHEILDELVKFYSRLYSSKNIDEEKINNYLSNIHNIPELTEQDKEICEAQITETEVQEALKLLKFNKSPGIDGLPGEFYQTFWYLIGNLVTEVYQESFNSKELPESMKTSILSPIFKKNDRENLQNYRPLSLTTCDYKILAIILSNRLQKVIEKIISEDQTAYIKKRVIGQNIRLVEDVIDYCKRYKLGGAILFLDFHKAFDSIEIPFLLKTLERFNFGHVFIQWIKTLYNKPQVLVKNNGWLSKNFTITRGIRQGCPLSALLFIIAVEILGLHIKQENSIPGICIKTNQGEREIKISQYADDTNLFLKRIADVEKAIAIVDKFSEVAGPILNIEKTEGLKMFADTNNNTCFDGISWKVTPIRCLGIYVGLDKVACNKQNWLNKLDEMQRILDNWRSRDLTLFGRITIVKVLGLSKLIYSVQNTDIPDGIIPKVSQIIHRFIWNGPDRVKRNTIIEDKDKGGLNMVDLNSYFSSIKSVWIKRILNSSPSANWSYIAKHYLSELGNNNLFLHMDFTSENAPTFVTNLPKFYYEVITAFNSSKSEAQELKDMPLDQILNMSIWGNKLIQHRKQKRDCQLTLFYKHWVMEGFRQIKDLELVNKKLSCGYIYHKLQDKRNIHIEINILQKAMTPILEVIQNHQPDNQSQNSPVIPNIHSKQIYMQTVRKYIIPPKLHKWEAYFHVDLSLDSIHKAFHSKVSTFKDLKLAEFNFKILHFIVATGNIVNKWNKEISNECEICQIKNDLPHLLLECTLARKLWNMIGTLCEETFNKQTIILGADDFTDNYLISILSFCLYKFWLIKSNEKETRTYNGLINLVKSDLQFKSCVLRKTNLKQNKVLYETLEKLANNM